MTQDTGERGAHEPRQLPKKQKGRKPKEAVLKHAHPHPHKSHRSWVFRNGIYSELAIWTVRGFGVAGVGFGERGSHPGGVPIRRPPGPGRHRGDCPPRHQALHFTPLRRRSRGARARSVHPAGPVIQEGLWQERRDMCVAVWGRGGGGCRVTAACPGASMLQDTFPARTRPSLLVDGPGPNTIPFPGPRLLDLEQFKGEHADRFMWGTYRPGYYLGARGKGGIRGLGSGRGRQGLPDGLDQGRRCRVLGRHVRPGQPPSWQACAPGTLGRW